MIEMITTAEFNDKRSEGWFYCRIILQIVGKPIDYVEKTLNDYIEKIDINDRYLLYKKEVNKPEKLPAQEGVSLAKIGDLYSAFAELEILFKNVMDVINFSFDYMPSSIEIIEPVTLVLKNTHLTTFINDLLGKLHELNYIVKNNDQTKEQILKNQEIITRNLILVALMNGPKDVNVLCQLSGLPKDYIEPITEKLLKENLIVKENDVFKLRSK